MLQKQCFLRVKASQLLFHLYIRELEIFNCILCQHELLKQVR